MQITLGEAGREAEEEKESHAWRKEEKEKKKNIMKNCKSHPRIESHKRQYIHILVEHCTGFIRFSLAEHI